MSVNKVTYTLDGQRVEFECVNDGSTQEYYVKNGMQFEPYYAPSGEMTGMVLVSIVESDKEMNTLLLPNWCKRMQTECIPESMKEGIQYIFAPGLEIIDYGVFKKCYNLELCYSQSLKRIGANAFYGCNKLKYTPDLSNVVFIGISAFAYCESLNGYCDQNCNRIEGKIIIPNEVRSLSKVFMGCESLKSVIFDNITYIDMWETFEGCINLKNVEGLFDNEKATIKIDDFTFRQTGLESIKINSNVELHKSAFADCPNLRRVVINTKEIPEDCFCNCDALEEVILMDNVKIIGVNAFNSTLSLQFIDFNKVENVDQKAFSNSGIKRYKGTPKFGTNCFAHSNIEDILIGNQVGERCFQYCKNAKRVILTNDFSMKKVGYNSIPLHALSKEQIKMFNINKLNYMFYYLEREKTLSNKLVPDDVINKLKSTLTEYKNCLYYPDGDNQYGYLMGCLSCEGEEEKYIPVHPDCVGIAHNALTYQNFQNVKSFSLDIDKKFIYDDVINQMDECACVYSLHIRSSLEKSATINGALPRWRQLIFDEDVNHS